MVPKRCLLLLTFLTEKQFYWRPVDIISDKFQSISGEFHQPLFPRSKMVKRTPLRSWYAVPTIQRDAISCRNRAGKKTKPTVRHERRRFEGPASHPSRIRNWPLQATSKEDNIKSFNTDDSAPKHRRPVASLEGTDQAAASEETPGEGGACGGSVFRVQCYTEVYGRPAVQEAEDGERVHGPYFWWATETWDLAGWDILSGHETADGQSKQVCIVSWTFSPVKKSGN